MKTLVNNKRERLIGFFLCNPTREIHLRGLARLLNMSPPGITKASKTLAKENIVLLRRDKEKKLVFLKANREHADFLSYKRSFNLHQLHKSGLISCLIEQYRKPEAIILFGSYARGEDTEESDIDIAILTKSSITPPLGIFEKKLSRKIKIITLCREKIEKEFWNTLANGIVLYGYLELPP